MPKDNLLHISSKATIADAIPSKIGLETIWNFTPLENLLKDTKRVEVIVTDAKGKTLNYTYYGDDYFQDK